MVIEKIKIHNFKSIYDEFIIDFDNVNGLWKVEGNVGAGKTTIGEAIIFGLFGSINGMNIPNLVSWGEKKGCVELWCRSKGNNLYIKRGFGGLASTLDATVDGEPLVFTNKRNAQQQLETEYYDVTRTTLELLCIISFNNFKSLATLNTRETKEFLDQVFGFYVLSNYADICKELQKECIKDIDDANVEKRSLGKQIEKIEQLANTEKVNGDLTQARNNVVKITKQVSQLTQEQQKVRDEYQQPIRETAAQIGEITALGKTKAKEIAFIQQGVCPTCGAPIKQDNLESLVKEKELLGKQYLLTKEHLDTITKERDEKINALSKQIDGLNDSKTQAQRLVTQLEEQEKRLSINVHEIDNINTQLSKIENQISELEKSNEGWSQLYDLLAIDIRQKILGSFIPLLNKSISSYVQQLQLPYIIEFDNQFKCMIRLVGLDQEVPIANLSTGQLKTVDMCVILGVLNVIMNNINFNVLFFDELLSNSHAELRNEVCRVIQESIQPNQTIFILSHFELDDKYFNGSIKVSLDTCRDNLLKKSSYSIEPIK